MSVCPGDRALARRLVRVAPIAALVLVAACGGGGSKRDAAVPTLLTTPSSTVALDGSAGGSAPEEAGTDGVPEPVTGAIPDVTTVPPSPEVTEQAGQTAAPGDPAVTSTTTASTQPDVEPSSPPPSTAAPIATSPQPPSTLGGTDADYLLGPRSVAGVQFGASTQTVLTRLTALLGAPRTVRENFADCANGSATAIEWYALGVIVTDRGLQYYTVGMATEMYDGLPVPSWHTAAGVTVGATMQQVQAAYQDQVTVGSSAGGFASFDITAGPDAGLSGQLYANALQSLTGGSSAC